MVEKNKPFKRQVLREDIKNYLLSSIMHGEYKPGERIIETQIARDLGVSQAPVREAIRDLEQMGVLKTIPFKGTYVCNLTVKDLIDVYDIRALLEGYGIRNAVDNITENELNELQNILEEMKVAAKMGDTKKQIELDIAFHEILIRASKNTILEKVWRAVSISHWTFFGIYQLEWSLEKLACRHQLIIDALKRGDCENAERIMKEHFIELKTFLESKYEK